jgi:hypothetical protein
MSDVIAPVEIQRGVKKLSEKLGIDAAAEKLEIRPITLLRVLAGTSVRSGTVAQIREKLASLEDTP